MAKPKIEYDIDEVNEILDLYKKKMRKEDKVFAEYKSKTISKFNEELVDNNIERSNGKTFTLYKYNFWAGRNRSTGDYNYGKKIIIQRNEKLRLQLSSESRDVEMQDIITIINKNIKNPNKLTSLLCHYLKKQKDRTAIIANENIKLSEENRLLKDKIRLLEDTYTNLFFNSQIPNNSLNDMLSLSKSQDKFICEELENMFDDGLYRFKILANLEYKDDSIENTAQFNKLQNIISLDEKKKEAQRQKELEDEGY